MCSAAAGSAAPVIEMVIINFGLGERPSAKYFSRRPSLLVRSFPTSIKSQSDHLGNFVCSSQQPNLGREPESPIELLLQIDWIFFVRMWAWVLWREMGAYYPILLSYFWSSKRDGLFSAYSYKGRLIIWMTNDISICKTRLLHILVMPLWPCPSLALSPPKLGQWQHLGDDLSLDRVSQQFLMIDFGCL